jgi:hypothetical protein
MTAPAGEAPLAKDFRSAQAISMMLGLGSVVPWVTLAVVVKGGTSDGVSFSPGPGSVLLFGLAMILTAFSAAAYAVTWVTVVVHRGTVSVRHAVRDAAPKD